MIDIIYPLGNKTVWQDNELRYSLRSLEMHLKDYRNIYVIGKKPSFLNDLVIEIPHQDVFANKARNIMAKLYIASINKKISQNFVMLNDDYFFLQPQSAANCPYYFKCDLGYTVSIQQNEYKKHALSTINVLKERGLKTLNFDGHYPTIFNKNKLKEVINQYDWRIPFGYVLKSLYCNTLGIEGEFRLDCKISGRYQKDAIPKLNKDRHVFSISDMALNQAMKNYIQDLYPNKSKFEK